MRVFKFNLATLLLAQSADPRNYICFTIAKMAEPTAENPDIEGEEYPRSLDVINKFRDLVPEAFKEVVPMGIGVITAHVTRDFFVQSGDVGVRMNLIQLAFERHGSIELEFEIDRVF